MKKKILKQTGNRIPAVHAIQKKEMHSTDITVLL